MARPLIISDCDEVLMHMVVPFRDWLDEAHDIHFDVEHGGFAEAIRHKHDGSPVEVDRIWQLLSAFFDSEMERQYPINGAVEAMGRLAEKADIVILTNLLDHRRDARAEQLRSVGIIAPVHTNQGGKGRKIAEIVAEHSPYQVFFIDDLAQHHQSALKHLPESWRLHMVGEPLLAPKVDAAPYAHARIDNWTDAEKWITEKINNQVSPTAMTLPDDPEEEMK